MNERYREICEGLDWKATVHEDGTVELEKYSPAGEDFLFTVDVDGFVENVKEYAASFDVDEHIEMWIMAKRSGTQGVPSTRELVRDAEDIDKMLQELAVALEASVMALTAARRRTRRRGGDVMDDLDYGWLAPDGTFTESPWGTHEESAMQIIDDKNHRWGHEYSAWIDGWKAKDPCTEHYMCRDFLVEEKGYCLIDSPHLCGICVTYEKPLTKKQREFLYEYFYDKGDRAQADAYLRGGDFAVIEMPQSSSEDVETTSDGSVETTSDGRTIYWAKPMGILPRRGRWISTKRSGSPNDAYKCSVCGRVYQPTDNWLFCPHCGSKMYEKEDAT